MKKMLLPSMCALAVTLLAFTNKTETIFELQPNGNYLILDDSKISFEDAKLILETTAAYNEQTSWCKVKINIVFKNKINTLGPIVDPAKHELHEDVGLSDCDKKDSSPLPSSEEVMNYLL
ncbi:hypothetical protein ABS768_01795 [Flavobacterium sp. ST-75]|uniref:GLPGLI family protein n=1 Tax=Flavobacterium rhizophilum TaxID=3163296 RepID=A0ABW8Y7M8_9FLAO